MNQSEFLTFVLGDASPSDLPAVDATDVFFRCGTGGAVWTIASDADAREVRLQPSVSTETSPGRRNCFWRLTAPVSPLQAQGLLAYLDPISPPRTSGEWRLPETVSTKRIAPHTVGVDPATSSMRVYTPAQIMALSAPEAVAIEIPPAWVEAPGPFQGSARSYLAHQENTRSLLDQFDNQRVKIASLLAAFVRRKFSEREAIWVAAESAAAKKLYGDWRYGVVEELAKIIVTTRTAGQGNAVLRRIEAIRGDRADRRRPFQIRDDVAREALKDFNQRTTVLHEQGGGLWAVEKQSGVAMELGVGNGPLSNYITKRYGINPVDTDHKHLIHAMVADAAVLPPVASTASLSYYDRASNQMMISFGGREIAVLGAHGISFQENGVGGIIMRPVAGADPIATRLIPVERALDNPPGAWWDAFMPPLHLKNIQKGALEEVSCLLHVWTVFCLFRNLATARPILTWLGGAGCLSGDTPVRVLRGGHRRNYSLSSLHRRFREHTHDWEDIPTQILSMKNGKIRYRTIKNVICSGEKRTYTVTVEGKKPFRVTGDHRFLTPTGFVELRNLYGGDYVIVGEHRKGPATPYEPPSSYRRTVKARFHPHARQQTVAWKTKDGKAHKRVYPSIPRCWAVVESQLNKMSVQEFLAIVQKDEATSKTLIYLPEGSAVHHKDLDPSNDDFGNLKVLTGAEHSALHAEDFDYLGVLLHPEARKIVAIEVYGEEMTYDIEMDDVEAPNFLVNEVVVHNSGKSTSGRKIHVLLYGMGVKLFDLDNLEHWQVARSNYPVTIWDNVDTPTPRWFGQGLAKSISDSVFTKRRLYSNNEPYQVILNSMVGLSAHDADFLREDIIDRMLLVQFRRFDKSERLGETEMIQEVAERREEYLAGLMADVIHVLRTERMNLVGGSSIRIADFATIGRWIAGAFGPAKLQAFDAALVSLSAQQTFQVLEEDALLIDALNLVRDGSPRAHAGEWFSAPQLWIEMTQLLDDDGDSLKRLYKNPGSLQRRLSAIHAQVSEHMAIETKEDEYLGRRVWRFLPTPLPTPNGKGKTLNGQA